MFGYLLSLYLPYKLFSISHTLLYLHTPLLLPNSDKSNFPGFLGANHAGINTRGPLKEDWTKPCPYDWPQEERDEKCISLQESIWGTKLLQRLEDIKLKLDPDFIFDCQGCVGNNLPKKGGEENVAPSSENDKMATSTATLGFTTSSMPIILLASIVGAFILLRA